MDLAIADRYNISDNLLCSKREGFKDEISKSSTSSDLDVLDCKTVDVNGKTVFSSSCRTREDVHSLALINGRRYSKI